MAMNEHDIVRNVPDASFTLKTADATEGIVLGSQPHGGIVIINGREHWVAAAPRRVRNNDWQDPADHTYTDKQVSVNGFRLEVGEPSETVAVLRRHLQLKEQGEIPPDETNGADFEGTTYRNGELFAVPLKDQTNPELLAQTYEVATKRNGNNEHPRTAFDIAHTVADAALRGTAVAERHGAQLVFTEVPEGGSIDDAKLSDHAFIRRYAPSARDYTLDHWDTVPEETIKLYKRFSPDPRRQLAESTTLLWPVQGFHHHAGVPQIDGLADPRSAWVMAQLRQTMFAKLLEYPAWNSSRLWGEETALKGVRSMARYYLATTHDSSIPNSAQKLMDDVQRAMREGKIGSPARYPFSGQHYARRFRMDGTYQTVEDISNPMTPDLRVALHLMFGNQVLDTIGQQALVDVGGDETKVLAYLQRIHPELFAVLPALGPGSAYEQDVAFNRQGYHTTYNGVSYPTLITDARDMVRKVGGQYTALETQAKIVDYVLRTQTDVPRRGTTLEEHFGIENGVYQPNGKLVGIPTDVKYGMSIEDLITIQAEATKLQAQALAHVRDNQDLLEVYGIK